MRCFRPPVFEGDLSEWGKTQLDDFFDDDQSMSSHPTLSSGVSPRDAQARVKPFDLDMAREVSKGRHVAMKHVAMFRSALYGCQTWYLFATNQASLGKRARFSKRAVVSSTLMQRTQGAC